MGMAKPVFGMNQSLDGYVDHMAFAPSPTLFRHFIEEAQGQTGSVYGRQMYEVMRCMGISRLTVKKILNHAERDVTAVYDRHSYDPEKRTALDAWGRGVEAIVSGHPQKGQIGADKLLVWGPGRGGRLLQIIFVVDEDGTAFVIHGRELTKREKGLHRKKR
jgi:hypothetical protein